MKIFRPLRLILLALLLSIIPMSSYAGVFISVNFAPPILPVYEQPPCPDEGLMWVPGYWAYGEDGYYWIPGTWVPAPYEGALWTPPYWGWEGGFYIFHPGYWGRHVGYYGGVNYGYGYMGVGFVGGMWRGHNFEYNRAVMHVDERRIHNVYEDRTIVERNTIVNDRHVSFSGGRDGVHHDPRPEERVADRDQHVRETSFQQSHENAARSDRSLYVKNNGGHPSSGAVQRPFGGGSQGGQQFNRNASPGFQNQGGGGNQGRNTNTPSNGNNGGNRNVETQHNNGNPGFNGNPRMNNSQPDNRQFNNPRGNSGNPQPQPQPRSAPEFRQAPQPQPRSAPEFRQMPQQQQRPEPQPRPQPQMQQRPEPQQRPQPQPQQQPRGNPPPQQHGGDKHEGHDDHQH